jgi:hypothetical protein
MTDEEREKRKEDLTAVSLCNVSFKKRALKGRPRQKNDITSESEEPTTVTPLQKMRRQEKGISVHVHSSAATSNDADASSRFVPHQEAEEDRWKLKSGGGLILLQFTTTRDDEAPSIPSEV